jgi:hypothetical protein
MILILFIFLSYKYNRLKNIKDQLRYFFRVAKVSLLHEMDGIKSFIISDIQKYLAILSKF